MRKRITILVAGAIASMSLVWGCGRGDDVTRSGPAAWSDQFLDGSWEFRIDRIWINASAVVSPFPSNELAEADYRPLSKGPVYPIVVSDHASRVVIGTEQDRTPRLHF